MRIAIIGSGAIGGVFANKLQSAGHTVNFFSKSNDAFIECLIHCNGQISYEKIINSRQKESIEKYDITIIAVKIYDLQKTILEYGRILDNSSYILPVQSYINFDQMDWRSNVDKVYPVAIMFGAFGKPTSLITYFSDGFICLGNLKKTNKYFPYKRILESVCQVFITDNINFQMFIKVLVNASIVSFCIESLSSFSKAIDTQDKMKQAATIFLEGVMLAKQIYPIDSVILPNNRQIKDLLTIEDSVEIINRVITKYPDVIPSIVFDVIRQKQTELKYIYDDIIELGYSKSFNMQALQKAKTELLKNKPEIV